jgi:hypothetical protein
MHRTQHQVCPVALMTLPRVVPGTNLDQVTNDTQLTPHSKSIQPPATDYKDFYRSTTCNQHRSVQRPFRLRHPHTNMAPAYISEGTQCTLLTLPGDVRSRIMEYALTSSAPLHLVSPLKTAPKGAVRPFSAVMAARLCAKRPILVDPQSETGDGVEFNQIKYVCSQLKAETAGHELRFNDIIIAGEDSTCKQLLQFGEHIGSKTRWLKNRTITLLDLRPRYGNPGELTPPKILISLFPDTADMIAKTA